jgi:hypothetical protein
VKSVVPRGRIEPPTRGFSVRFKRKRKSRNLRAPGHHVTKIGLLCHHELFGRVDLVAIVGAQEMAVGVERERQRRLPGPGLHGLEVAVAGLQPGTDCEVPQRMRRRDRARPVRLDDRAARLVLGLRRQRRPSRNLGPGGPMLSPAPFYGLRTEGGTQADILVTAIDLVMLAGASTVILLGADGGYGPKGRSHCYDPGSTISIPPMRCTEQVQAEPAYKAAADRARVPIWNCSPQTMIEAFPVASLETVLEPAPASERPSRSGDRA